MNHPLDGARLKIVRAQEHLDALKAEVRMYLDEKPYEVVTEKNNDTWTFRPAVTVQPPLRLSTIIGDCLVNSRGALDYIVWQLAVRYLDDPPFVFNKDRRWISFPLYNVPSDLGYIKKIDRFTDRKIPADAITEIQASQPYHPGKEPMWWLHELVNVDKHRLPLLTFAYLSGPAEMRVMKEVHGLYTIVAHQTIGAGTLTVTDSTFTTKDPSPGNQVHVNCEAAVFVALQDATVPRIPVDTALQQIVECVANTIPRFDRFFI